MKKFILVFAICLNLVFAANSPKSEKNLRVFGATPPITVLLQILAPETLVGLNYKPYPEDLVFMHPHVQKLEVLGMLGGGKEASFERLLSHKVDVVFVEKGFKSRDKFEKAGIKVVEVETRDLNLLPKSIEKMSEVLGTKERGKKLASFVTKALEISQNVNKTLTKTNATQKRIYLAQGEDGLKSECGGTLFVLLNAKNAVTCSAEMANSRVQLNFERLLLAQPDAIFVREIRLFNTIKQQKKWQTLHAVRTGNVFYAPSSPSNWLMRPPSVLQSVGVVWALSSLYPELVSPAVSKEFAFSFYAEFLQSLNEESYQRLFK